MRPDYKIIVCATDCSPVGDRALPLAYTLAGQGSTVHLLTVVELDPHGVVAAAGQGPTRKGSDRAPELARARAHLDALCAARPAQDGVRTEVHVADAWDPVATIEALSGDVGADVVVIGTHGRTGLGRLLMGSVATELLRRRRVPILLLHDVPRRRPVGPTLRDSAFR